MVFEWAFVLVEGVFFFFFMDLNTYLSERVLSSMSKHFLMSKHFFMSEHFFKSEHFVFHMDKYHVIYGLDFDDFKMEFLFLGLSAFLNRGENWRRCSSL